MSMIDLSQAKYGYHLNVLFRGLSRLFKTVEALENKRNQKNGGKIMLLEVSFGNEKGSDMIMNYFLWYSLNLATFLKLHALCYQTEERWEKEFTNELKWRNKVSAHTAMSDPRKDDNVAVMLASVAMTPEFENGRYVVGGMQISISDEAGEQLSSPSDWKWSLTVTHERLCHFIHDAKLRSGEHSDDLPIGIIMRRKSPS